MSRVVVIGATGHIGTYLVPRLVRGGHEVIAVSRGIRGPCQASPEWDSVTRLTADREAQAFERALTRPAAIGASFHVVAGQAMTLRGLAAGVAAGFGRQPVRDFVDWAEFERRAGAEHAGTTREHTDRSITASTARARDVLGYAPRHTSLGALHEALAWLAANGQADIGGQRLPAV